jgi:hypothetical protein
MTIHCRTSPRSVLLTASLLLLIVDTEAGAQRRPDRAKLPGSIEYTWKPVRDGGAEVVAIEVRTELKGLPDSLGRSLSVMAPVVYAGVTGIADRVQELEMTDASGTVSLQASDDPPKPGGFPYYRHWRAQRPVRFPVVFTYRSLVQPPSGGGPPFGIKAYAGGVSGAGSGFLVLPELSGATVTSRVRWDLSGLATGSSAVTTFGEADFSIDDSAAQLAQGWIMAGPLGRYPESGPRTGFSAAWLGTPEWDPVTEMRWAEQMYQFLAKQYKYLEPPPPYRVFIRVGFNSGTALTRSFMGGGRARQPGAAPSGQASRGTFTHEMGHMWVGGIQGPEGVTSWFSEGLNTYYTRLLPMRGGFTSVEEYGRDVNRAFKDYYTNVARNLSADSIVKIGFGDGNVRHIPYVRGALYFADLDSKIRAYSGNKRNLDKVMFDVFQARERGEPFTHETWKQIVIREAGPNAAEEFERIILKGETLLPASDAFGPCFERRPAKSVSDGKELEIFEWVRVANIPDEKCREPW